MSNNVELLSMCLFAIHIPFFFGDMSVQISSLPLTHWVTSSKWLLCASDSVKQRTATVPTSWGCCDSASNPRASCACPHPYSTELYDRQELYAWALNSSFITGSYPHLCTYAHTHTSHDSALLPAAAIRDRRQEWRHIGLGTQGLHLTVCLLGPLNYYQKTLDILRCFSSCLEFQSVCLPDERCLCKAGGGEEPLNWCRGHLNP